MNRRLWMLWLLVVSLAGIPLMVSARAALSARRSAQTRLASFRTFRDLVGELDQLESQIARWPERPADTNLAQEVSASLAAAGLPPSALANLSPDNGQMVPGSPELVQLCAGLTLNSVTLPEVGRFLAEWRRRQPAWTVTGIDLSPETGESNARTTGGDLPLRAVLNLESIVTDGGSR